MTKNSKPNRLIAEKSPYLLQHAYNPVNWYSWKDEAFETAKREDKPIFLSIGYSTCHWCHVMERESFEDEEVASLLNDNFTAIKVDREERPDIDSLYMTACQALTGHGGWPLTIIMTPEKKPFFAGTYFPKKSRFGMSGLMSILKKVSTMWKEDKKELIDSSESIIDAIKPRVGNYAVGEINEELLHKGYKILEENFDKEYGGFYEAPKFPTPHNYLYLLRYWKKTGEAKALEMVTKSLESIHRGGMYDHIGFGFARYSTDEKWLVPHFEKMLYDNALLAYTYLEAYQATGNKYYKKVVEQIFTYILRDMQSNEGGFYSAEDADSEGIEGKFYVWDKEEILKILGREEGELFCEAYNITNEGNFEGKNIPNRIKQSLTYLANKKGISRDELTLQLEQYSQVLFEEREKRVHPHKDDKILTSWNGLMIAAFAKGAQVIKKKEYSDVAEKAIQFILTKLVDNKGRLLARYRDGEAAFPAYIDDYAFLVWGLIEQYEATFNPSYLEKALRLNKQTKDLFWDENHGGYYFYGKDAENLFARPKEVYDGATPSGNSVAALNLLRLARITGDLEIERDAEKQIRAFSGTIEKYPAGYTFYLSALWFALGPTKEIVISGEFNNGETSQIIEYLHEKFLPEAVILHRSEVSIQIEEIAPFIKEQKEIEGKTAVYICENFACQRPITDLSKLKETLN